MPNKKPTLQPGEYAAGTQVLYVDVEHPELNGTYTVELGAERKHPLYKWTERMVRVDGHETTVYAMVREGPVKEDRKIERDERVLLERAAAVYVSTVLRPKLEKRIEEEQSRQYSASLWSTDNWEVEEKGKHSATVSIEPIGITCRLWDSPKYAADNERKRQIIHRLLALAKEHGI